MLCIILGVGIGVVVSGMHDISLTARQIFVKLAWI